MKRSLKLLLLLLAILLARPDVAEACRPSAQSAKKARGLIEVPGQGWVYVLGDKIFKQNERYEYLFQKYPNIVIASLEKVTDGRGRPHSGKLKFGEKPHLPLTLHFKIHRVIKGKLGKTFKTQIRNAQDLFRSFSSCAHNIRADAKYLYYWPELPESGAFPHTDVVRYYSHHRLAASPDIIKWFEDRMKHERDSEPNSGSAPK